MSKKKLKADAVITNKKRLPLGILTADCVPILIYDDVSKMIAAIHAGWKGAFKGIINRVIKFMIKNKKFTYKALLPEYFKKLIKSKRLNFLDL